MLHIKEYVPPTINDIDKVLEKLKFNYATKKYKYETYRDKELIDQKLLAKMAGVTRQTVARWEQMGFIYRSDVGLSRDRYFQIKEVISQLEKLKE
ncbi:helix-turn-helix domain-containing protein [uncultured Rikenella sp.]|uniref:helix-turn-helix domain-containing protein n=1 Tax=uncultured Rikenella sp. TaxID=368003 RepID=UPI0025F13B19|nr:helix-turn-helix domain-containing protein [uncultured Rikenella sp.]